MSLLSIFPVIGQLAGAASSYFQKREDVKLEKYKVDGKVDEATIVGLSRLSEHLIQIRFYRVMQGFFLLPTGVYYALIVWDSCMRKLIPGWTWRVLELPENVQYIPYAVVGYLFVKAWRNK